MTDRQRETLTFIRGYLRRHGIPPTMDEIAAGIGVSNKSTAWSHVQALVKQGQLAARTNRGVTMYFPVEQDTAAA